MPSRMKALVVDAQQKRALAQDRLVEAEYRSRQIADECAIWQQKRMEIADNLESEGWVIGATRADVLDQQSLFVAKQQREILEISNKINILSDAKVDCLELVDDRRRDLAVASRTLRRLLENQ